MFVIFSTSFGFRGSAMSISLPAYGFVNGGARFSTVKHERICRPFAFGEGKIRDKFFPSSYRRSILRTNRNFRIYCVIEAGQKVFEFRKCAPLLESTFLEQNEVSDSTEWKAVPDIWRTSAEQHGDRIAVADYYHDPPSQMTYKQLEQAILDFAEGLRVIGICPDQKIALFADNSCHWLVADQGIMASGAINVVRGSRSSMEELLQIYNHSDSVALIVDNPSLLNNLAPKFNSYTNLKFVVVLWGEKSMVDSNVGNTIALYSYDEFSHMGHESRKRLLANTSGHCFRYEAIKSDDVATLVYTSGTTGTPKGVMLTHKNLLHQIMHLGEIVPAIPGDRFLSLLPPWHMYERAAEYFTFTRGVEQVYTNVKNLKEDLKRYQTNYLVSVPLVYDILYSGIQKQLSSSSNAKKLVALTLINISMFYMEFKRIYEGKSLARTRHKQSLSFAISEWIFTRILAALLWPFHLLGKKLVYSKIHSALGINKSGISGGGSLPSHVDRFFEAIGITLLNGYGLTESSPVICARPKECNVLGTVGRALPATEVEVFDSETGNKLPAGSKGIVKVRGPQIMKGYYKNLLATNKAIDKDGWLDTGDIGWIVPQSSIGAGRNCGGMLVLEGRAKDTIVLSSGENVEPEEIEEAAMQSNVIHQIVVVGQDQRRLGALIVPNKEELDLAAKSLMKSKDIASEPTIVVLNDLIRQELNKYTSSCSFQIGPFLLLEEPFTIENGLLTPTLKIRRDIVFTRFHDQIVSLFK
ncbi:long-chain-fatty-acid--[acyl-carrier-protein] ligase AEE15, chloroplastic isoform X2 [Cryptomeria japonica]|nr:long-chain-fatty-acid--[acyl-carrier-protein] ligase AEE15, chloroplastic isoform X2 [Cryptomeria japonica]